MTKKSRQKLKYIENKKSFLMWNKKTFFIIFKGLLVAKNFLKPESAPLKQKGSICDTLFHLQQSF